MKSSDVMVECNCECVRDRECATYKYFLGSLVEQNHVPAQMSQLRAGDTPLLVGL